MNSWEVERFHAVQARLDAIEAQLEIVSAKLGVPWERPAGSGVPDAIVTLVKQGQQMEAIRALRIEYEMSLVEAKQVVDDLAAGKPVSIVALHR